MSVDFGKVSNYLEDRGFGFITGLILGETSEVFFHIRTLKKADPQLAVRLEEDSLSDIYFWFEVEKTARGKQVSSVLTSDQVRSGAISDTAQLVKGVEARWRNAKLEKAEWLDDVTVDLVGRERAGELSAERKRLENEQRRVAQQARQAFEAQRAVEKEKEQAQHDARKAQNEIEETEFQELVAEMKLLGLTHSSQVSNYIVTRRLGYKYRNISGVLQMELNGTVWDFKGGFPPKIYARLCDELKLLNEGTRATPIAFESFDSIEERRKK